ncbi:MAG: 1,4-alpha-glucan branching protein GlgB [Oscillospiraceae bacterium]|nr:1,4-alpha-glucan branching protein GlgB [Oscillospiraceae bacterium]
MKKSITNFAFTRSDKTLLQQGTWYSAYQKLGAHPAFYKKENGVFFSVWAPHAKKVNLLLCSDAPKRNPMPMMRRQGGVWELFVPGVKTGDSYRFSVLGADGVTRCKADPFAFSSELRPARASVVADLNTYVWQDGEYLSASRNRDLPHSPMAVYEVHLGSWKRDHSVSPSGFLSYRELAPALAEYVCSMGYTHVELIGICEHPFDGSWGYQCTGFFAPTSRYGMPDDFRFFVDTLHQAGIGVILDWVPAHFPKDDFSLSRFDGTPLYEPADPLFAEIPCWGTLAFDHSKPEVRSFLISSAIYWMKEFHIDAIRTDAVAAMLYRSFGRNQWSPNKYGGEDYLEGMLFLRQLTGAVHLLTDGVMIAEDSSILPGITLPVAQGGYGFDFKWNLGWMNDTLIFFDKDPIFRRYHHECLTHTADYAFQERWILPLSHDEVVHCKRTMLGKMPGQPAWQYAGLMQLYLLQLAHPGKKLLFMGQEFAEKREWDENREINWALAKKPGHRDVRRCICDLFKLYKQYSCLYAFDDDARSFQWINRHDADRNIIAFLRKKPDSMDGALLFLFNFSPVEYAAYSCGVPLPGVYRQIYSTVNPGENRTLSAKRTPSDGCSYTLKPGLKGFEALIFELPQPKQRKKP